MKCLVFDIWGDFAHYRKFYTTSSPLTFSVPPRTAISGMISAIIGIDKEEYLKYFSRDKANIAVRIMKPIKKTRINYNFINTKTADMMSKIKDRTQVTMEVVKDCRYRIYFSHLDNEIYDRLKEYLMQHKSYYTPCLGLSEFIANFEYIDEVEFIEKLQKEFVELNCVVPFDEELKVQFEENSEYFKDTFQNEMNENREVTNYIKIIYERNCKLIKCDINKIYESKEGEKIVFL